MFFRGPSIKIVKKNRYLEKHGRQGALNYECVFAFTIYIYGKIYNLINMFYKNMNFYISNNMATRVRWNLNLFAFPLYTCIVEFLTKHININFDVQICQNDNNKRATIDHTGQKYGLIFVHTQSVKVKYSVYTL